MTIEKDFIKIPLTEWEDMKKIPRFSEFFQWLEDSLELEQAIEQEKGEKGTEWRKFCAEEFGQSELLSKSKTLSKKST